MEKELPWIDSFVEKRNQYGVSQQKLALLTGVSRQYLNLIENQKVMPTIQLQELLLNTLERLNPDSPLDMVFDYVRIRFTTLDCKYVMESILKIKFEYMIHEKFGFYSYDEHYHFGNIFLLVSKVLEKGVLLELKGKGCRQFENFLEAQNRSWYDFFIDCINNNAVFKRLDLAINDKQGILDIPALINKCQNEECVSLFRNFKSFRSGELTRQDEKVGMGNTLYIGSLQSEVYFCIYQKDYEQYVKLNIPIEDAIIKNRFEIRLRNDRARLAIMDLLAHNNPEKTAFKIINHYLRFVDKDNTLHRSNWKTNEDWLIFIGKNRGALKLTMQPEPYNIAQSIQWLQRQVAPTLKTVQLLDKILNTNIVEEMIKNAKITKKHEQILHQITTSVNEMTHGEEKK